MLKIVRENIKEALKAIRSQLLRTILTVAIIAVGIVALVGILTSIDAINSSISSNFSSMGSNTFTIRNYGNNIQIGRSGKRAKRYPRISIQQALDFKDQFDYPASVSVSTMATALATIKFESEKTNPNIFLYGVDENYLYNSGYVIENGRNFTETDIRYGSHGVIIGKEIQKKLFPNKNPIDELITIGSGKYRVIGVLEEKGSSMAMSGDKNAFIPLTNARQYFPRANPTFAISVKTATQQDMTNAIGEATGLFRVIRKDPIGKDKSFEIVKSDNVAQVFIEAIGFARVAAIVIGIITLLGSAIGLMNMMLVSVTDRTREIGVRKAIGASSKVIMMQFIIEAIVICQLGGIFGVILGIVFGNIVGTVVGSGFIIPWAWMILGLFLCFLVGVLSGIYPAFKASKLDPIESLRYE